MKLSRVADVLNQGWFYHHASEGGLVHLAIFPVLYGFRVRAWLDGDDEATLDWCCGDNAIFVSGAFSAAHAILSGRAEDRSVFDGVPRCSDPRPYFKDLAFMDEIFRLAGPDFQPISIPIEELVGIHRAYVRYALEERA